MKPIRLHERLVPAVTVTGEGHSVDAQLPVPAGVDGLEGARRFSEELRAGYEREGKSEFVAILLRVEKRLTERIASERQSPATGGNRSSSATGPMKFSIRNLNLKSRLYDY